MSDENISVGDPTAFGLGSTVQAQSNLVSKYYDDTTLTIQSCVRVTPQRVTCTGSAVNNRDDHGLYFRTGSFRLISPNGDEAQLSGATVRGESSFNRGFQLRKGISYPIQLTFDDYTATAIKYLDVADARPESRRFENVPLLTAVPTPRATPTPAPAPVRSGAASNLGPGQVVLNGRAYTVALTGCTVTAAGAYACTGATATPLR